MQLRGRLKQLTETKVNRINDLVFKYKKLKKKLGKNAVLDKLKMHIRHLPSEEEQIRQAAEVVFELSGESDVPYLEVLRKVICLTGLTEAKVDAVLFDVLEELAIEFEEMSDDEVKTAVAINKDDVMDVYCDVLLKRRFQKQMMEK
ncbi:MAG: hypothetical protein HF976_15760 [ANME-2 cluster archaeon]|nr:hypothetical protein [ANME-2 cluster archaeon]MBC2702828.1 hypothetical protein [ANME-2 cluster archaeon]MBC2708047.1 hypothetical protein [ANME-2 cluster archaeon]MBC2747775.1 hypothetical protein [ANME-2 cluster archaeon]MBC2763286.1 hypothetical protein [ANME-2 cluster archaeon]